MSTRKYLLYAIGEIALVVIGILIALQINNWNERRKAANKEIVYLKRLTVDLKRDKAYFERRLQESEEEIQGYYELVHEARKYQSSAQEFMELIEKGRYSSENLTVQNSTYNELINTGNIELIRNDNLKVAILDIYNNYESVGKHIEEINFFSSKLLGNESTEILYFKYRRPDTQNLFDRGSFFHDDEWTWINNPKSRSFRLMEENVGIYYYKHNIFIGYFKDILMKIEILSQMTEDELRIRD